jgi:hypothetical protein
VVVCCEDSEVLALGEAAESSIKWSVNAVNILAETFGAKEGDCRLRMSSVRLVVTSGLRAMAGASRSLPSRKARRRCIGSRPELTVNRLL